MNQNVKKLTTAGLLIALGVVCSAFYIPIGASKCFPIQHMVNVIAGVLLGPGYAVSMAFGTSLIRNLMGTGSLLAFPGSMIGAFCCGMLYKHTRRLPLAYLGEVAGTGILGGLACYPVATLLMGKEAALFAYVLPFLVSTLGGATISVLALGALQKTHVFGDVKVALGSK
ncbi:MULTISPECIES: energy coupling factor transporter S component ThiW [Anaerotruncus]|jgi:energy coupling factor transporter S component ThiW|uniref:energy coupling factor transporter S component ThiW n=1 Tax=Anaerotruncus TaxID=244127 RepID=UPI00082BC887|nr:MULTISPECIES: energy coupling factor transporter S component ThiW [Anaerotruncus]RGX54531.1 energy coupling factor transporter S component ThiW [Anaerotruncus sp. AF02-27]